MISARKAKHLGVTTMFTYSHANTPLGQSERAYYLSYFINYNNCGKELLLIEVIIFIKLLAPKRAVWLFVCSWSYLVSALPFLYSAELQLSGGPSQKFCQNFWYTKPESGLLLPRPSGPYIHLIKIGVGGLCINDITKFWGSAKNNVI